jgi:cellulose synthase/poly-beta-1,6-N-acetylglucosamine synthase-like glycosyltransferase
VRRFHRRLSADAVDSLFSKLPSLSARVVITRKQAVALAALGIAIAVACWNMPYAIVPALVAIMSAGFVISTAFRATLAFLGGRNCAHPAKSTARSSDAGLPPYTVLVPLYREAAVLPELVRVLRALDYPREKLDIKLIVEEDDSETRSMAEALAPEGPFEIIRVPYSLPRTKPKACNYALRFARGEYLVIYDAEDRPEPDQLRKAVDGFRDRSRRTACLQARLDIYNASENWLSRMFALDYAIWFKAMLPGLDRFGVPMPLGGTSNHFRTSILREVCGWDPFNVTEDADLGIRLAQLGYRVSMLDSTTFEEAPAQLSPWLRQRSRWLKGYMQTWLVHAREPASLVRRIGIRGVAVVQLFIGGGVWSALVNPVLWLIFAVSCVQSQSGDGLHLLNLVARISGMGLLAANVMLAATAVADAGRLRRLAVVPYGLSYILYWALVSVAAYRGLWQLVFKPFYWEKTPHGARQTGGKGA